MRIDRLTNQLQLALSDAQSLALGKDHNTIDPLHLISALLNQKNSSVRPLLLQAGANVHGLSEAVNQALNNLPTVTGSAGDLHMSNDLGRVLNIADQLSQKNSDTYISSEVVVVAMLDANVSVSSILLDAGVTKASLQKAIESVRGGESIDDPGAEENRQALDKYTIDLTALAEEGKLDPVIGRDDEIRRTIQVLQRRTKNNPVLIGEPGVGKTAICLLYTSPSPRDS